MAATSYEEELAAYKKECGGGASEIPGQRESTYEEELEVAKKHLARYSTPAAPEKTRPKAVPLADFEGQNLQFATPWKTYDTGVGLPPSITRGLAQLGSGFKDWDLGTKQLINDISEKGGGRRFIPGVDTADADEKRRFDDPLNRGVPGTINNLAGKMLPAMMAPNPASPTLGSIAPVVTGALGGAAQGAIEPVATGESRFANMGIGTLGGAGVPGIKYGLQRSAGMHNEATNKLAQEAIDRGIKDFGLVDTAKPGYMTALRHVAKGLPASGGYIARRETARHKQFTQAVGKVIGVDGDLTLEAVAARHQQLEDSIKGTWATQPFILTPKLERELKAMQKEAGKYDNEVKGPVQTKIQNFIDQAEEKTFINPKTGLPYKQKVISGEVAHNFQQGWAKGYDATGADPHQKAPLMNNLYKKVNEAFGSQLPETERKALEQANTQLQATKAILPAAAKSEVGQAQREVGEITPQDLSAGILNWYGKNSKDSPFGRLGQIGQQINRDTSTKDRTILANSLLPHVGLATTGFGGTMGYLSNPSVTGAGMGAGAALAGLGGITGTVGAALSSPGIREAVMREGASIPSNGIRAAAIQGPLAWREKTQADEALGPVSEEEEEPAPRFRVDVPLNLDR